MVVDSLAGHQDQENHKKNFGEQLMWAIHYHPTSQTSACVLLYAVLGKDGQTNITVRIGSGCYVVS
jgi:hypothetical protein